MDYVSPQPTTYRKAQIEDFGSLVAEQLGYQPSGDIESVVKALGGVIEWENPFDGFNSSQRPHDESIIIEDIGKFTIFLPAHTSLERDRFTIAHELGHYLVHYWQKRKENKILAGEKMAATRYGSDRVEWEANWFAAGFLMPKNRFKLEDVSGLTTDSAKVTFWANLFGVSTAAAEIRAKALNLIGQ